jgi:hypothetical protein
VTAPSRLEPTIGRDRSLARSVLTGQSARVSWTSGENADETAQLYSRAFPAVIRTAAEEVLRRLPTSANRLDHFFVVTVDGESLSIPYRTYNAEPPDNVSLGDATLDDVVRWCYFSRHHNGYVRQRCLRHLLVRTETWVVPFVVQLVGEYVIEIIEDIRKGLDLRPGSEAAARYGRFVADNPAFFDLTSHRVTSYWSCYHRLRFPVMHPGSDSKFEEYPGFTLIAALRSASMTMSEIER